MSTFANIICRFCKHKNYFVRLKFCPNCDKEYQMKQEHTLTRAAEILKGEV